MSHFIDGSDRRAFGGYVSSGGNSLKAYASGVADAGSVASLILDGFAFVASPLTGLSDIGGAVTGSIADGVNNPH